jgi:pyoverdine/dityrosine biosynthesis protein Dit1
MTYNEITLLPKFPLKTFNLKKALSQNVDTVFQVIVSPIKIAVKTVIKTFYLNIKVNIVCPITICYEILVIIQSRNVSAC